MPKDEKQKPGPLTRSRVRRGNARYHITDVQRGADGRWRHPSGDGFEVFVSERRRVVVQQGEPDAQVIVLTADEAHSLAGVLMQAATEAEKGGA